MTVGRKTTVARGPGRWRAGAILGSAAAALLCLLLPRVVSRIIWRLPRLWFLAALPTMLLLCVIFCTVSVEMAAVCLILTIHWYRETRHSGYRDMWFLLPAVVIALPILLLAVFAAVWLLCSVFELQGPVVDVLDRLFTELIYWMLSMDILS